MIRFNARVLLYDSAKPPGRDSYASGIRPSFNYKGELVACEIKAIAGDDIPVGGHVNVSIELPYGEMLNWELTTGTSFLLNAGSKVIGEGVVTD